MQTDEDGLELGAALKIAVHFGEQNSRAACQRKPVVAGRDGRNRNRLEPVSIGEGE